MNWYKIARIRRSLHDDENDVFLILCGSLRDLAAEMIMKIARAPRALAARAIRYEHKARASVINGTNDQIIWGDGSKRRARSFTPLEYALSYDD